jgi:ketosteroid isomerase-like protein
MEVTMKYAMVLLGCLVLVSCAPAPPDITQLRKDIDTLNAKAEKEMVAGTMDTTMSQYSDDPISMPNNGPLLKGKTAIKEYYAKMMGGGFKFTKVRFVSENVMASGQYVVDVGTYSMTMQMGSLPEMSDEGKYLTVYERGADGKLRIKVETWNTNKMPMPGAGS